MARPCRRPAAPAAARARPATRSSAAAESTASRRRATARAGRCATPPGCRHRSGARSSGPGRRSRIGAPASSASSWCAASPATRASPPPARPTPCRTVMGWSGFRAGRATGTPPSTGARPSDLRCADVKGGLQPGNGRCRYPLTVTGHAARSVHARQGPAASGSRPASTPSWPGPTPGGRTRRRACGGPPTAAQPRRDPRQDRPSRPIRCTTATSPSPPAASASAARRSTAPLGDRQLPARRSRLHQSGAEHPATPRPSLRARAATHALGTGRHSGLRAGHSECWLRR